MKGLVGGPQLVGGLRPGTPWTVDPPLNPALTFRNTKLREANLMKTQVTNCELVNVNQWKLACAKAMKNSWL